MTQPKTDIQKTRAAFRRAFRQGAMALPTALRLNWRNVLMPWRMLPSPVALALVAVLGLALILDATIGLGATATVGGQPVPSTLHCQEDEVIALDGVPDTLFCVHIENVYTTAP